MLMNPQANKEHALDLLAEHFETPMSNTVSFGDDLVDIAMLRKSGRSGGGERQSECVEHRR